MLTTIRKSWSFDAAHQLPHHDGKCARPHGHTYTVTVEVRGYPQPVRGGYPKGGMVVDFTDLNRIWKQHLEPLLDHQDLNQTLADHVDATTSELIAGWLFGEFSDYVAGVDHNGAEVLSVTVSETASSSATVRA